MRKLAGMTIALLTCGCSIADSRLAMIARQKLVGLSEVEIESCLGAPDQHSSFGSTDVLTWYANSTSTSTYSGPGGGGLSFTNGGYCHVTARVEQGQVVSIRYTGENNAFAAPFAYCAPIVRSCVNNPPAAPAPPQVAPAGLPSPSPTGRGPG